MLACLFSAYRHFALLLAALAFMAVPASSEAICSPHDDHGCSALHQAELKDNLSDSQDAVPDSHQIHSHGTCHVSMTVPDMPASLLIEALGSDYWVGLDSTRMSLTAFPLERPPRA